MDVVIKRSTKKAYSIRRNVKLEELLELLMSNNVAGLYEYGNADENFYNDLKERNYILIDSDDPHLLIIQYRTNSGIEVVEIRRETFRTQIEVIIANKIIDRCIL